MMLIRYILYPFAVLYDAVTSVRNLLFDKKIFKSIAFEVSSVGVGNLNVGGSGKTPMIEYLIRLLSDNYQIATLSRGYKRTTKGYLMANDNTTTAEIGDEPSQFYFKYGKRISVAVGEERVLAIPAILSDKPETDMILLDDVYQHRHVKPKVLILLSTYQQPFYHDLLLPSGRLRESRRGAERADIIIVTKCPQQLDHKEKDEIRAAIAAYNNKAPVFFTSIVYGTPLSYFGDTSLVEKQEVVLLSGLANADLFETYASTKYRLIRHFRYQDHYDYTRADIDRVQKFVKNNAEKNQPVILTTEKDIVKLRHFDWTGFSLVYLPIEIIFQEDEDQFKDNILSSV